MLAASPAPDQRPVLASGAVDCAAAIARARLDLRGKLKAAPGEARTRAEIAWRLLDEAAAFLLDPGGPRVPQAEFLLTSAQGMV
jgi:hypothetical protein